MIFISHRGNLRGPNPSFENRPEYILNALDMGFDVEIDVWYINGRFKLGHDSPQYPVKPEFLLQSGLWCHAKHFSGLIALKKLGAHHFWHQTDAYTLTSNNVIWAYPDSLIDINCICLMPETRPEYSVNWDFLGVCSDYIEDYKIQFSNFSN